MPRACLFQRVEAPCIELTQSPQMPHEVPFGNEVREHHLGKDGWVEVALRSQACEWFDKRFGDYDVGQSKAWKENLVEGPHVDDAPVAVKPLHRGYRTALIAELA